MVDTNSYNLYKNQNEIAQQLQSFKNVLLKTVGADPEIKLILDEVNPSFREDNATLSERKRQELTELLHGYKEPRMDRHQHDTYLQTHRKWLEELAELKRQEAAILGRPAGKQIKAEDLALYSFSGTAGGRGALAKQGPGAHPLKGLDPQTGEYTIVLEYEGSVRVKQFEEYIRIFSSSKEINLYETIKSFFRVGQNVGMTKLQLARLLIDLLIEHNKRLKEQGGDTTLPSIYMNEVEQDPHRTIAKIIAMVSRSNRQHYLIYKKLEEYTRPAHLPIDNAVNTLLTMTEEYFQHVLPYISEEKKQVKVEERVLAMLPDLVSKQTKEELKKHIKNNNNNGIDNTLEELKTFISKVEGDMRIEGGQRISPRTLSFLVNFNQNPTDRQMRKSRRDSPRTKSAPRSRTRSSSGTSSRSASASSVRSRRNASSASSRSSGPSRSSSVNSNTSISNEKRKIRRNGKDERSRRRTASGGRSDRRSRKDKKTEAMFNDKSKTGAKKKPERPRSESPRPSCNLCYDPSCPGQEMNGCHLRPKLVPNRVKNGPCGICKRGFHVTTMECFDHVAAASQAASSSKN